jgi:tripartite-type tricarboxylate transporter receptor subunit TctC
MIVPFAPGGGNDVVARIVAQRLTERLGQSVVVDNKSGANGIVGLQLLKQAKPDGYTIATTSDGPVVINPAIYSKLPYDSAKDFVPVAMMVKLPAVLVAHPSLKITTVQELIDLARKQPGKISYSSGGIGNYGHMAGELFSAMTGVNLIHAPYKGTGPATNAVLSGEVGVSFAGLASAMEHVKSGRLVALAIGEKQRLPALPNLPTISESGVPDFEANTWVGIIAPAQVPKEIVDRLGKEIMTVVQEKDVSARLHAQGLVLNPLDGAALGAQMARERVKWADIATTRAIKAE